MEREVCVCDHGFERSDLCAEIIIIIIIPYVLRGTSKSHSEDPASNATDSKHCGAKNILTSIKKLLREYTNKTLEISNLEGNSERIQPSEHPLGRGEKCQTKTFSGSIEQGCHKNENVC